MKTHWNKRILIFCICFLGIIYSSWAVFPIEEPTINLVTPTSVTIVWKTDEPVSGSVQLTNDMGYIITSFKQKASKPTVEHQVTLSNLKPETKYGYQIVCKSSKAWYTGELIPFMTAVKKDSSFLFASLADGRGRQNGVNVDVLTKIITGVLDKKPNLMIFQGDLIGGYCDVSIARIQYNQWKKVVQPFWQSAPIYPGIGNHDCGVKINGKPAGEKVFADEFVLPQNGPKSYKEVVYSFDYSNCHFISLDSNDLTNNRKYNNRFSPEQLAWLEKDLASTKQLHKFVYLHDPAYPCGAHIGSSLDQYPEDRDKFLKILDKYDVDMIFCGHEHNYDRKNLDHSLNPVLNHVIYQVKNGTCGAPVYKTNKDTRNQMAFKDAYDYTITEVNGSLVTVRAYDIDGNKIDQFTYNK